MLDVKGDTENYEYGRKMNGYILFFGYVFYRIEFVYKRWVKGYKKYGAADIIALMQMSLLLEITLLLSYTWIKHNSKGFAIGLILYCLGYVVMLYINEGLLGKRYWRFHLIWMEEPRQQKRLRGRLIVASMLCIFLFIPALLCILWL